MLPTQVCDKKYAVLSIDLFHKNMYSVFFSLVSDKLLVRQQQVSLTTVFKLLDRFI